MNYTLSKSHVKMLKVVLSIWAVIVTALTLSAIIVFFSKGAYSHPFTFFVYIFAITSYINIYRFFSMVYDSGNQISLLQFKIWLMIFVRGGFGSLLYLSIYVQNILGIIFFTLTYLGTFFCNYYLTKAVNNEKQKN